MSKRFRLILGFLVGIPLSALAGITTPFHEYKLDNGLKLIVREDHRSPLVVVQVWYKVGSSFEPNGITGISHALEHMMFRGTKRHPQDEFSRLIAVQGGDQSAMTFADFTVYYQELDKHQLELCFELEADRMQNLTLPPEAFNQEIKVVKEERRLRTEDNPEALAVERLNAAALIRNPYHHPVVGWMDDLENMQIGDLESWYKSWYGPNNAFVVVVGDVNPETVFKLATSHFGALKPIPLANLKPRKELPFLGKRQVKVKAKATVPRLLMGYNVPSLLTAEDANEAYALLVLLMALDGGNSSRFSRDLIREQKMATDINSWYDPFSLHETLLVFSGIPAPTHNLAELEEAFLKQVTKLQSEPLSEEELHRIKINVTAQQIFAQDSMFEQAMQLGQMEAVGLPLELANTYPSYIQKITAEQVQKVAQKYLISDRLTTVELIPLKSGT